MPESAELYFNDPRLQMTLLGRFLVRLASYLGYLIAGALMVIFLLSDSERFFFFGILLAFFLGDRLLHIGRGDESLMFMPKRGRYNIASALTSRAFRIIESALDRSLLSGTDFRFLLIVKLFNQKEVVSAITRLELNQRELLAQAEREFSQNPLNDKKAIADFTERLAFGAFRHGRIAGEAFIEPRDLCAALAYLGDARIDKLFSSFSIARADLETALIFSKSRGSIFKLGFGRVRHRTMNRAWTAKPTPLLDRFSFDLTDSARYGQTGFLIGHAEEYKRLVDVLSRPEKPSALLVGDPGIGKEAVVGHLAFNIVKDNVPPPLFDKRLVALHIERLVSGAVQGKLQERLTQIVEEIVSAGNIILYIPDIDNLAKTSGEQYLSAADTLLPAIRQGLFPTIGATYPREYKKYIETQSDFISAFEVIRLEEISEEDAAKVLTYSSLRFERQYKIVITLGAIKKAVTLAHKYFHQQPLPAGADDLLKEALGEAVRLREKVLNADLIVRIAERKVNIPLRAADGKEAERLLHLEEIIHRRLIDQEEAVKAVALALREYRSGLSRKGGPIASFLFVGPTGVGKTELSKILAEAQFGSVGAMLRFDMSEYQDKHSLFRFIGSPDGAISGALTDAVLQKPYSLILLDEFEKANPDILNLFLPLLDEGRLTDNLGRVVDFKNTVIIATSNARSEFIKKKLEQGGTIDSIGEELKKHLSDYFKPELLNRFSGVIVFKTLSFDDLKKIVALRLNELVEDLAESHAITLTFANGVVELLARLGFNDVFGARPLRNVISEKLRGPLAEKILAKEIGRNDKVEIGVENGEFRFYTKSE